MKLSPAILGNIVLLAVILTIVFTMIATSMNETPFHFNSNGNTLPPIREASYNDMVNRYNIEKYMPDINYLITLGNAYNKYWSMTTDDYTDTNYSIGDYTSIRYLPISPAPKILIYTQTYNNKTGRLTASDYYGNGFNNGFINNGMEIMIECDCSGISVFKRGNYYEDRYTVNLCED
jgi:hypothetical protein